jgi:hypothetical protein
MMTWRGALAKTTPGPLFEGQPTTPHVSSTRALLRTRRLQLHFVHSHALDMSLLHPPRCLPYITIHRSPTSTQLQHHMPPWDPGL